ncbi:MAG: Qat anti-phage system QueC-like protein QatC, partial [Terriglobia bacterium]
MMKIVCAPLDFRSKTGVSADLEVVVYSHPDKQTRGGIGANIRETIARLKLKPTQRAWDFLSIALAVLAADTAVRRNQSPDGWTRELDLQIAVGNRAFWSSHAGLVENILRFLTTDIWRMDFLDGGIQPVPPKSPHLPEEDCVSLLSGGLDSLVGAVDLATR